ncbi:MAG: hypothetical protein FJY85_20620 [Deltaproteobacteria bacterium]|nr:hypothetical protein [Deltaproteobacteria bacterium]
MAFSRAQELLVIFGAKDMYYDYPVKLANMTGQGFTVKTVYRSIINELERKGCFWPSRRLVAAEDYQTRLETWRCR